MTFPLLACLLLAGIHVYLGIHVLARKVIFVDLALAQIAALGAIYGILLGYDSSSDAWMIKAFSLVFAVVGAAVFSLTRTQQERVPHEAIIGVVYAVAVSLAILLSAHLPHGADEFRELLSGSILWVDVHTLIFTALLYGAIGLIHFIYRRQFIALSFHNQISHVWDFCFYVTFAFVVTSSVAIAGVLLVFCYLIIPALIAVLLVQKLSSRLIVGWIVGALVSFAGVLLSYYQDLPSGPTIVVCFAVVLIIVALRRHLLWLLLIIITIAALCYVTSRLHHHPVETVSEQKAAQLSSHDDHERQNAIRDIRRSHDKSRVKDLIKAISIETDDYLKIEMAQTLLELGDKRGMAVLTDVMKHGETEQAREEAKGLLTR